MRGKGKNKRGGMGKSILFFPYDDSWDEEKRIYQPITYLNLTRINSKHVKYGVSRE